MTKATRETTRFLMWVICLHYQICGHFLLRREASGISTILVIFSRSLTDISIKASC